MIGYHRKLWVKNVCAIGLAAGFIEPLESNGLFSVHEFIHQLVRTLQRESVSQWDRDVFNAKTTGDFQAFAEFVSLHYALSHRDDTEYWRDLANRQFSKELVNQEAKIDWLGGFVNAALDKMRNYQWAFPGGLPCVTTGLHYFPVDFLLLGLLKSSYVVLNYFEDLMSQKYHY